MEHFNMFAPVAGDRALRVLKRKRNDKLSSLSARIVVAAVGVVVRQIVT